MFKVLEKPPENSELLSRKSEHFCRYLGLVALALDKETTYEHLEQQVVTELAESLDTEMGTHSRPIELSVVGDELCDIDGRSMSESAIKWSEAQAHRAEINPELSWLARFAALEEQEHKDVVSFSKNANEGDTLIIISPFPEEAYESVQTKHTVAAEGFRPDNRRSFIRAYEKTAKNVVEHIQSVDSSYVDVWNEALGRYLHKEPVKTSYELLSQRAYCKNIQATDLIERIAMEYDKVMYEITDNNYRYGRNPGATTEANSFVRDNINIVKDTITELAEITDSGHLADAKADKIMYNSKALIAELFKSGKNYEGIDVRNDRSNGGDAAQARGDVFYGCSGANGSVAEQSQQLSHAESFTIKNGLEAVAIGSCPICGKGCITGIRDSKTKRFVSCTNKSCKAYNQSKIDQFNGVKNGKTPKTITELFGELLNEMFTTKKTTTNKTQ